MILEFLDFGFLVGLTFLGLSDWTIKILSGMPLKLKWRLGAVPNAYELRYQIPKFHPTASFPNGERSLGFPGKSQSRIFDPDTQTRDQAFPINSELENPVKI